jgi:hypothetical protein
MGQLAILLQLPPHHYTSPIPEGKTFQPPTIALDTQLGEQALGEAIATLDAISAVVNTALH